MFAAEVRRKRAHRMRVFSNWRWRVDEVFVKINGERRYLWRAVDHEGEVLEAVVTKRRNKRAALKSLRELMRRYGQPKDIVTDRLPPCRAALRELGRSDLQLAGRWLRFVPVKIEEQQGDRSPLRSSDAQLNPCTTAALHT